MSAQRGPSTADELVALAEEQFGLGRAEDGEPYAVERAGANVARFFRGGWASLRSTLAAAFAARHGRVPAGQALADALAVLEGRALVTERRSLPLRAARTAEGVIAEVGDADGRGDQYHGRGLGDDPRSPVAFRRSELVGGLPAPVGGATCWPSCAGCSTSVPTTSPSRSPSSSGRSLACPWRSSSCAAQRGWRRRARPGCSRGSSILVRRPCAPPRGTLRPGR